MTAVHPGFGRGPLIPAEQPAPGVRERHSLLSYSPAFILVAIVAADASRWADPDLWGHVRFGQAVLAQGHLVTHDPYSYSAPGHLWLNHEWLTEVLMAWLYNTMGVIGLKLMKLVCAGLTVVFMIMAEEETGAGTLLQLVLMCVAAACAATQMEFRPQVFTFAALSGLLALLARHTFRGSAPLWIAIPLLALWANLHGGFIMGLATLGIYSTVVLAEDVFDGRGVSRAVVLFSVTAGATLATSATPYAGGTWRAVLHALANPRTRVVITDWHSLPSAALHQLSSSKPWGAFYMVGAVALFGALAASFVMTPRGGDLPMVAVAGVMNAAAFVAIRNLPIAVIATVTPLARHLTLALEARRIKLGLPEPATRNSSRRANQAVVTAIAIALAVKTGLFSPRLAAGKPYPVGAVRFMKRHDLNGNILANFGWGEYLIWHLAPQSKVFIDGRYDTVFPQKVIDDFLRFHFALRGRHKVLVAYPTDFVLIAPDIPASKMMKTEPGWKLVYSDGEAELYARANSAAASIPGVPIRTDAPQSWFP